MSDSPVLLHVTPWVDAVVDALGEDPRSPYVERFWLPVVGPSTIMLVRRLADLFDGAPDGFDLDPRMFSRDIGVGAGTSNPAPFRKALERAERFGFVRRHGATDVVARRKLPPLTNGQVSRLPARHQRAHKEWQQRQLHRANHPATVGHATRLGHSLLLVGATEADVRDQLRSWRFDEPTVQRATDAALRRFHERIGHDVHEAEPA